MAEKLESEREQRIDLQNQLRIAAPKFVFTVQGRRIEDYMIMNVRSISVSGNNECVFAFRKSLREFISNFVCFFRSDLTGLERLTNLVSDYFFFMMKPRDVMVLSF